MDGNGGSHHTIGTQQSRCWFSSQLFHTTCYSAVRLLEHLVNGSVRILDQFLAGPERNMSYINKKGLVNGAKILLYNGAATGCLNQS